MGLLNLNAKVCLVRCEANVNTTLEPSCDQRQITAYSVYSVHMLSFGYHVSFHGFHGH